VIYDVGSASVGGAIVDLEKNTKPHVLYSIRAPLSLQEDLTFDRFVKSMLSVFLDVSMQLKDAGVTQSIASAGNKKISATHCILSSAWFVSATKTMRIEKNEPFVVTEKILDELFTNALAEFKDIESPHVNFKIPSKSVMVDSHILATALNGYYTTEPLRKTAKTLESSYYFSMAETEVVERLSEMMTKFFHVAEPQFHSYSLASFAVLRDLFEELDHYMIMDISGELTDVTVVHNDIMRETASFPIGHNSLIRDVQRAFATTPREAKSRLTLFTEDKQAAASAETVKMENTISLSATAWAQKFEDVLKLLEKETSLPSTLFITGMPETVQWYVKALSKNDFSEVLFAQNPFRVTVLEEGLLSPCCTFSPTIETIDPFLSLESLFFNRGLFEKKLVQ